MLVKFWMPAWVVNSHTISQSNIIIVLVLIVIFGRILWWKSSSTVVKMIGKKLSLGQFLFSTESSCTSFSLIFPLLSLTCWPIYAYAVEKVVRLSWLRLLFITVQWIPALSGKSDETGGISLSYPTDRALFSWVSLFRPGSTSVCAVPPLGCLLPACCPVGAQPWPQSSVN